MIDRRCIGFSLPAVSVHVDRWRVELFCQAIGEEDPAFWERAVPPTFLKAIEGENHSSRAILEALGVPLRNVLHAEQSFEYIGPVYVGDEIRVARKVVDVFEKKGGALEFIAIDSDFTKEGSLVCRSRQLVMVRRESAHRA
jgi:acyl dehydratase